MEIMLSPKIKTYWINSDSYYSMQNMHKFISYFFDNININITDKGVIDGMIYDIQDDYEIPNRKLNIMICVENCPFWSHYKHYNKYNNYENKKIKVYLYNHIDKLKVTDTYIAIPVIYLQINYFKKFYNSIKPTIYTSFKDKKFCLITTKLNTEYKKKIYNLLSTVDKCDLLSDFSSIINKSCYHDLELLNLFNQYKFIFVCENSICDGYITEKIFNCYFSRSIPIYHGPQNTEYYFNKNTFINLTMDFENVDIIKNTNNSKELYEKFFNNDIINNDYDDENYQDQFNKFIDIQ